MSYCVVGAVISEWLGGYNGLGVYMTRVRKSYAFDKMFAVILLISVIQPGFDEAGGAGAEEMHGVGTNRKRRRQMKKKSLRY